MVRLTNAEDEIFVSCPMCNTDMDWTFSPSESLEGAPMTLAGLYCPECEFELDARYVE